MGVFMGWVGGESPPQRTESRRRYRTARLRWRSRMPASWVAVGLPPAGRRAAGGDPSRGPLRKQRRGLCCEQSYALYALLCSIGASSLSLHAPKGKSGLWQAAIQRLGRPTEGRKCHFQPIPARPAIDTTPAASSGSPSTTYDSYHTIGNTHPGIRKGWSCPIQKKHPVYIHLSGEDCP